jgi:hypothetical protein
MARALDHEVMLVPRVLVPVVQALITGRNEEPLWSSGEENEEDSLEEKFPSL